jgi:DNA-directed RNA polymerase specialized sigma24 family protein
MSTFLGAVSEVLLSKYSTITYSARTAQTQPCSAYLSRIAQSVAIHAVRAQDGISQRLPKSAGTSHWLMPWQCDFDYGLCFLLL